jgi:hypothetical protein
MTTELGTPQVMVAADAGTSVTVKLNTKKSDVSETNLRINSTLEIDIIFGPMQ